MGGRGREVLRAEEKLELEVYLVFEVLDISTPYQELTKSTEKLSEIRLSLGKIVNVC